jgi:hypothetical protein
MRCWPMALIAPLLACGSSPAEPDDGTRPPPSFRASHTAEHFWYDLNGVGQFVSCPGGPEENVMFSGTANILYHVTVSSSGRVVSRYHANLQGVIGVGDVTGRTYRPVFTSNQGYFGGRVGEPTTQVLNLRMIVRGSDTNFLLHQLIHVTVNANGTITAATDRATVACG